MVKTTKFIDVSPKLEKTKASTSTSLPTINEHPKPRRSSFNDPTESSRAKEKINMPFPALLTRKRSHSLTALQSELKSISEQTNSLSENQQSTISTQQSLQQSIDSLQQEILKIPKMTMEYITRYDQLQVEKYEALKSRIDKMADSSNDLKDLGARVDGFGPLLSMDALKVEINDSMKQALQEYQPNIPYSPPINVQKVLQTSENILSTVQALHLRERSNTKMIETLSRHIISLHTEFDGLKADLISELGNIKSDLAEKWLSYIAVSEAQKMKSDSFIMDEIHALGDQTNYQTMETKELIVHSKSDILMFGVQAMNTMEDGYNAIRDIVGSTVSEVIEPIKERVEMGESERLEELNRQIGKQQVQLDGIMNVLERLDKPELVTPTVETTKAVSSVDPDIVPSSELPSQPLSNQPEAPAPPQPKSLSLPTRFLVKSLSISLGVLGVFFKLLDKRYKGSGRIGLSIRQTLGLISTVAPVISGFGLGVIASQ